MLRGIFEILVNVLEVFIIIRFLSLYLGYKYEGTKKYTGFCLAWGVMVVVLSFINHIFQYEGIIGLIFMFIYFLYAFYFLRGSITMKIFTAGFTNFITYLISFCAGLVIKVLGEFNLNDMFLEFGMGRVLWIGITKIILLVITEELLKFKFDPDIKSRDIWILVIISVLAMSGVNIMMHTSIEHEQLQIPMLAASVVIVAVSVFSYYIYIKICNDSQIKTDYEILQKSYELDKRNSENIQQLYENTCTLRHDMKFHLQMIRSLMNEDLEKAKQYIGTVLENQMGAVLNFIKTDNKAFDAIINTKLTSCKSLNIETELRIMNHSLNALTDDEIGVLFGNLFDNAIEASKDSEEKRIVLEIQKQDGYTSVFMSNSIDSSVIRDNAELKTTKKDENLHGYGTKSIRKIVDKKEGIIKFFEENGNFCCDILI